MEQTLSSVLSTPSTTNVKQLFEAFDIPFSIEDVSGEDRQLINDMIRTRNKCAHRQPSVNILPEYVHQCYDLVQRMFNTFM